MEVTDATKLAFNSDGVHKTVQIYFPELELIITNDQIDKETLKIKECVISGSKFEIVGCISSVLTVNVYNVEQTIKGKKIEVYIQAGDTEIIPIFKGIVDSSIRQSDRRVRAITAYDLLYSIGDLDVSEWYNSLNFSISIKKLRNSLFTYINQKGYSITQKYADLPNDDIIILKEYDPKELNALEVIKNICQFNAVFGIINRDGQFEYILPETTPIPQDGTYPSTGLFPSLTLYPSTPGSSHSPYPGESTFPDLTFYPSTESNSAVDEEVSETLEFSEYKECSYEDYIVRPITKVTLRESANDYGKSYGYGDNNYIIQGNIFAYHLTDFLLETAAENICKALIGFNYTPFNAKLIGAPYLECGKDSVTLAVIDYDVESQTRVSKTFFIIERELSGVQCLTDTLKASGEEDQKVFITDLGTNVDKIEQKIDDINDDISDLDDRVSALEDGGAINIESVAEVPENPSPNTIYVVRGVIIIE